MVKNTSTEYVSLFKAISKMPTHSVDTRQPTAFWFCASLALFGVLSTLCPLLDRVQDARRDASTLLRYGLHHGRRCRWDDAPRREPDQRHGQRREPVGFDQDRRS